MELTTASSPMRINLGTNKSFWMLTGLFLSSWIYGWFDCHNQEDWIIENLLVVICLAILVLSRKIA